jgi:adenylosuccinate synthase
MRDARIAEPMRFSDLSRAGVLALALGVQERLRAGLLSEFGVRATQDPEWVYLDEKLVAERWLGQCKGVAQVQRYDREKQAKTKPLIFEGAQGVLLDEMHGFAPYTTWSNCTFENAEQFLESINHALPVQRVGVVRAYAVRHGAGPLPTEERDTQLGARLRERERHNTVGPWQGSVRVGAFDAVLFKYACEVVGELDELVVTHMDAFEGDVPIVTSYAGAAAPQIMAVSKPSRSAQAELAQRLFEVQPIVANMSARRFLQLLAELSTAPQVRACFGPTSEDLQPEVREQAT